MGDGVRNVSRRDALKAGVGVGLALSLDGVASLGGFARGGDVVSIGAESAGAVRGVQSQDAPLITRPIPSSGERVPVVGIGTARNYENPTPEQMPALRDVIDQFPKMGGRVLDTAPAYGRAETVVGDLMAELKNRDKYFIATKVSVRGGSGRDAAIAQMEQSLGRFHTDHVDLMQVWNLSQPDLLLPVIDEWKAAKKCRYVGVTTSNERQYAQLEALMNAREFDFIQVDLAIDNRRVQQRIIPLAMDRGFAVLINLPFGRGRPFERVKGKALPGWARDIDCADWSQVFLKYIIGNPGVTCVIPGTEKVEYLKLNLGAARGRLPDAAMRRRIEQDFDALSA